MAGDWHFLHPFPDTHEGRIIPKAPFSHSHRIAERIAMREIERAFKEIERKVRRHARKMSVTHSVRQSDPIAFNDLERSLLRFLKDEFLEKGSGPAHLAAPATLHRDVMQRFNLDLPTYREVIARLESLGIVEAPTIEAHNGCLRIAPEIVEIVRQIDEEESPVSDYLQGLMAQHGEDFDIQRAEASAGTARGLRNHESATGKAYIGFFPDTDVKVGDVLVASISSDEFRVIDVGSDIIHGGVLQIKAFTESEGAYQQRIAQSQSSSINVGTMTNSAIQQNSPGAFQSLAFTQENRNDIEGIVDAILTTIDQLGLANDDKSELLADIESIQAQLKKAKPTPSMIRSCLEGVRTGLTKVATSAASSAAAALAKGLIEKIGNYFGGG